MGQHEVTVTRTIQASPSEVWACLTEPAAVAKWMMGARVESSWEKGARISWAGEYKGQSFEDKGEVLEIDPGRRLVHTHFSPMSGAEDKPENYHRLTWSLAPDGDATELTLVQDGASSAEEAEQFERNWGQMLDALRQAAEG